MRLIGGAILLTVLTSTTTVNAAHQDNDEPPHQTSPSLLRGTHVNKQHAKQLTAAELFPIYDPLQEQDTHTIADHGGHSEHDYVESTCNADLDTVTCINWSEYFDNSPVVVIQQGNSTLEPLADYLESEVKIPCGVCVTLDASPGDDLYNTTIEFGQGLNVVGKLVIPNDAKVHLRTKYVYVQGVLSMPEPPSGSSSGIPSEMEGDRVEITLYGKDNVFFKADEETDNYHHGEKGVNNKAIVIAGGKFVCVVSLIMF